MVCFGRLASRDGPSHERTGTQCYGRIHSYSEEPAAGEIHSVYFLHLSGLVLDFSITSRLASTHHLRVWVGDTHGVRHHHGVSRGMIGLGLGSWWRPRAPPDFHPPVLSIIRHLSFLSVLCHWVCARQRGPYNNHNPRAGMQQHNANRKECRRPAPSFTRVSSQGDALSILSERPRTLPENGFRMPHCGIV